MYFRLIFAIASCFAFVAKADARINRDTNGKSLVRLDMAIELINATKINFPKCPDVPLPLDCEDVLHNGQKVSGVYEICPRSRLVNACPLKVYCDMETDGGGWTVIQRRGNYLQPIDYFYKDWETYKKGFGNIEEDFWLGNDNIFAVSNQKLYSIRFDLQDVEGERRYALYDTFWIDDEENLYRLHLGVYSGDVGDSMTKAHNGKIFSTKDRDNPNNCAEGYKGGWWYSNCHTANLNGLYHRGEHKNLGEGVNWVAWKGYYESLEETEIKIRSKDFKEMQILFKE